MKRLTLIAALALTAAPVMAAPKPGAKPVAAPAAPSAADWRTPDPQNLIVIDTNKGRVIVELAPEAAPAHVQRVRELARAGFYDGRSFFRVIDAFMAQTGDPKDDGTGSSDKPDLPGEFTWRRGTDSAFTPIATPSGAEVGFVGSLPVMSQAGALSVMTADGKVAAWGLFCPGVAGMARSESPDSANSQFFLMRQTYPSLDKRYTAFGRAVSGLDAIRAIKAGEPVEAPQDKMLKVRVLADLPEAERPRVKVIDPKGAWFKAKAAEVRAARGADFSACDIDLPSEIK